jgi:hypothetical protein
VAEVVKNDSDLKNREFQVAGRTDSKPLKGGEFKTTGASRPCALGPC